MQLTKDKKMVAHRPILYLVSTHLSFQCFIINCLSLFYHSMYGGLTTSSHWLQTNPSTNRTGFSIIDLLVLWLVHIMVHGAMEWNSSWQRDHMCNNHLFQSSVTLSCGEEGISFPLIIDFSAMISTGHNITPNIYNCTHDITFALHTLGLAWPNNTNTSLWVKKTIIGFN